MNSKKALNELCSYIELDMGSDEWYKVKEAREKLEKDLETLEILKKKEIDIPSFKQRIIDGKKDFAYYCNHWMFLGYEELTKEEFEIIKECLENEK